MANLPYDSANGEDLYDGTKDFNPMDNSYDSATPNPLTYEARDAADMRDFAQFIRGSSVIGNAKKILGVDVGSSAATPTSNDVLQYNSTSGEWDSQELELTDVVEAWKSDRTYDAKDLVSYSGEIFKSINGSNLGNTPSNNSLFWQTQTDHINIKMSAAFANGFNEQHEFEVLVSGGTIYADVGRVDKTWDSGTAYDTCERVIYNGALYACIQASTNNQPDTSTSYWRYLSPDDGNLHCTIDGSDLIYTLDVTTGSGVGGRARVALTAGTSTVPVLNQVYGSKIAGSTILTLTSGSSLPSGCVVFAGYAYVQDATTVSSNGSITQQRYTNSFYRTEFGKGLIGAIRERLRVQGIEYFSGCGATATITTNPADIDNLRVNVTSGITYQLWPQLFPDYSTGTPEFIVLNDPTTPYRVITDLADLDVDANGDTLRANNTRYGLKIVGIQQSGTNVTPKLGVLLPTGSYSTDVSAINDTSNYDVASVEFSLRFTIFQICRVVVNYSTASSGTFTNLLGGTNVQDRRNWKFTGQGGGGGTGGAVWGDITGTLSDQTDLQTALNLKADKSNVLELDNTSAFTPDADYEPATKKYVDDNIGGSAITRQSIAYAASITPNIASGNDITVGTLTGDITVNNATNATDPSEVWIRFTQDATGGRTVTLGANYVLLDNNNNHPEGANEEFWFNGVTDSSGIITGAFYPADTVSELTTKGDLLAYSTEETRLAAGTNDQVLTVDSTAATGLAWKTPSSGGGLNAYGRIFTDATSSLVAGSTSETKLTVFDENSTVYSNVTLDQANDKITITSSGDYKINFRTQAAGNGVSGQIYFAIFKNGSALSTFFEHDLVDADIRYMSAEVTAALVATDYIEVYHYSSPSTNMVMYPDTILEVSKLN